MPSNEFSTRLKQAMSEAGMNQADVIHSAAQHGKKLGKSQVSQYVSGKLIPQATQAEYGGFHAYLHAWRWQAGERERRRLRLGRRYFVARVDH